MKQIVSIVVSVLFLNLTFIPTASALNEKNAATGNTAFPVEIRSTPEKDIAGLSAKQDKGFISKYKWWILGGIAVIGGAAAAAGGGSSDSTSHAPAGNETGSAKISW